MEAKEDVKMNALSENEIKKCMKGRNKYLIKCFMILNDRFYLSLVIGILFLLTFIGSFLCDGSYFKNAIEFMIDKSSVLIIGLLASSFIFMESSKTKNISFPITIDVFKDNGFKKQIKILRQISESKIDVNLFEQILEIEGNSIGFAHSHDITGFAMYHPEYGCKCLIVSEKSSTSDLNCKITIRFDKNDEIRIHTID